MSSLGRIVRIWLASPGVGTVSCLLDEHLPDVERVPVSSNAEGARRGRDEQGTCGDCR